MKDRAKPVFSLLASTTEEFDLGLVLEQHCNSLTCAGVLSEEEYIREYCRARGTALPDPDTYSFCLALALFRMAAILAGVGARALAGNASSSRAAQATSRLDRNHQGLCSPQNGRLPLHGHLHTAKSSPASEAVKNEHARDK